MTEADLANLAISDESPEVKAFWKAMGPGRTTARMEFEMLWSTLHAKPGERWSDNPGVVRIPFKVLEARG